MEPYCGELEDFVNDLGHYSFHGNVTVQRENLVNYLTSFMEERPHLVLNRDLSYFGQHDNVNANTTTCYPGCLPHSCVPVLGTFNDWSCSHSCMPVMTWYWVVFMTSWAIVEIVTP